MMLKDGEYAADGYGGFVRVSGAEEKLQRALFLLTARRGGFAPEPDIGSRLYTLPGIRRSERESAARQFAAEALYGEDVSVRSVSVTEDGGEVYVHIELESEDSVSAADIAV